MRDTTNDIASLHGRMGGKYDPCCTADLSPPEQPRGQVEGTSPDGLTLAPAAFRITSCMDTEAAATSAYTRLREARVLEGATVRGTGQHTEGWGETHGFTTP